MLAMTFDLSEALEAVDRNYLYVLESSLREEAETVRKTIQQEYRPKVQEGLANVYNALNALAQYAVELRQL